MIRPRLRVWGLLAVALCTAPSARARQDRPDAGPAARASGEAGKDAHATPSQKQPQAKDAPAAAPAGVPAPGPAAGAEPVPASATPSAPKPADPTEGDRTAFINQDVAQHPPQTAIASRDPSHLQTAKMKLGGLLDRSVHSLENNEVGRVIDVMTGDDGKPAALELDVGGFLGVGNRRIAVAWSLFDLSRTGQNDPLRVALSAAQVRSAPAMDDAGETPVVTGATPVASTPAKPATDALPSATAGAAHAVAPAPPAPALPPASTAPAPSATTPPKPDAKSPDAPSARPADSAATSSRNPAARRADHEAAVPPRSRDGEQRF